MPQLSWNEVRDRAIKFSRDPVHTRARSERANDIPRFVLYDLELDEQRRPPAFPRLPLVNGGLFREPLRFARFNRTMRDALLFCCDFQWAKISPTVFGSLFQGVMEDRARRQARGALHERTRHHEGAALSLPRRVARKIQFLQPCT